MVILKMIYVKYPLKCCAIGLYFILIATCVPTAFAQSQDDAHPCLLSVNKVTPLDVSFWTGAALFAPEILENIEIIYTYPIGYVTESSKIDIDSILIGKIDSDNQLVVESSLSSLVQKNNHSSELALAMQGAISDTEDRAIQNGFLALIRNHAGAEDRVIIRDQIQNLPDYSDENRYWTLKQSWESAMAHSMKQVWAEEYSQIEVNPDTSLMRQGSDSQRKGAGPLLSCLDAESVE